MKGKYTYTLNLCIGFSGAERTGTVTVGDLGYEKEEWDAISDEQRKAELDGWLEDWANEYIEMSWS